MRITKLALEKSLVVIVLVILLVLSGFSSYNKIPKDEDPGFIIRVAVIMTYFPGASSERVENLVTDKLEKAIQEMPELDYIESISKPGVSILYVNIEEKYKKMRPIWDSLRRKVDRVRPDLPSDVLGPYVNDEFGDVFGTIVTIRGEGYDYAELKDIADDVRDYLLNVDEIAKVDLLGVQDERIFVEFNNSRLSRYGLSPFLLRQILESKNIIIPGGDIKVDKERILIEPSGNLESVEELKKTVVNIPGREGVVYLQDLANIYRGYEDPATESMHYVSEPCIGLAISLKEGGNIIDLGEKVKAVVKKAKEIYPIGVDFDIAIFQPDIVKFKIDEFTGNLIQAVIIVMVVLLVALGWRTGLIVSSLVPVVIIVAFTIMFNLDIWLDQVSLAALIIALGILVDNSIVISESIMVQANEGKSLKEAAIDSTKELFFPLLISTLSICCAFLPIFLAESAVGEYCAPLFKVVSITLLTSLVLAVTFVPIMCCAMLKVKKDSVKEDNYDHWAYKYYRNSLIFLLRYRFVTIFVIILIFLASMWAFQKYVPNIFMPKNERAIITAEIELPLGTPIERTQEVVNLTEKYMKDNLMATKDHPEGIKDWISFVGNGGARYTLSYGPEMASPEYSMTIIRTTSSEVRDKIADDLRNFCFTNFPDAKIIIKPLTYGIPFDAPVEVRVSGKDTDKLNVLVNRIKKKLATINGVTYITDDWGKYSKKFLVEINPERAFRAGITNQDVAISLQTSMSGLEITQYREDDKIIPVLLRAKPGERKDFTDLANLNVYVQMTGQSIPLKQVANIKPVWEPAKIIRRDRIRTVTIQAQIDPNVTAFEVNKEIFPWLQDISKDWKFGYSWELGGETEKSQEANKSIEDKMGLAALIILFLLIAKFNSIRKPLVILVAVPLGMIGVSFGLIVCQSYFGFMTLLGVIALSGIVINNSVVLLERINTEIVDNKLSPDFAIVVAAQRRMRPILLTASSTIGGLIPLWLSGGALWEAMAISIIFGLAFATVLTLGVVPVMYSLLFNISYRNFNYTNIHKT